jgi:hypothetical protein
MELRGRPKRRLRSPRFNEGRSGDPPRGSKNRTGIAPASLAVNFLQKNSENSHAARARSGLGRPMRKK